MNVRSEIYMLTTGLRNKDFRPGQERDNARLRLRHLQTLTQDTDNRTRGTIRLV